MEEPRSQTRAVGVALGALLVTAVAVAFGVPYPFVLLGDAVIAGALGTALALIAVNRDGAATYFAALVIRKARRNWTELPRWSRAVRVVSGVLMAALLVGTALVVASQMRDPLIRH